MTSQRNLLEYVRLAASGFWVIVRNIHNLSSEKLSIFAKNIESCWISLITRPEEGFFVDTAKIMFKTSNLKIFATT